MNEHVFLSHYQYGIVEDYWIIHFLNNTNVLTNMVNCSGNTFILTLFWRVLRDLRAPWHIFVRCSCWRFKMLHLTYRLILNNLISKTIQHHLNFLNRAWFLRWKNNGKDRRHYCPFNALDLTRPWNTFTDLPHVKGTHYYKAIMVALSHMSPVEN